MPREPEYRCLLGSASVAALEAAVRRPWGGVMLAKPVQRGDGLRALTGELRIRGEVSLSIGVLPVEIGRKVEVFGLQVDVVDGEEGTSLARSRPPQYEDAGELLSAFIGVDHRVLIGARLQTIPGDTEPDVTVLIEDLLVLRHSSGQQAFVAPDDQLPGRLVVARRREDVPLNELEIAYMRVVA